ncbi:unnamed protein product, partial [Pylaiella littoralis]
MADAAVGANSLEELNARFVELEEASRQRDLAHEAEVADLRQQLEHMKAAPSAAETTSAPRAAPVSGASTRYGGRGGTSGVNFGGMWPRGVSQGGGGTGREGFVFPRGRTAINPPKFPSNGTSSQVLSWMQRMLLFFEN